MRAKMYFALVAEFAVFAAILFGAAGRLDWREGWAFLAVFFGCAFAISEWVLQKDPALMAERLGSPVQRDQPVWDRFFLPVVGVVFLGWLTSMGLDARYGWSDVPVWLEALGGAAVVAGFAIVARVFAENTFLAPVVKVQAERAHRVISTGPYAVVRHPMYAGAVLVLLGSGLLAGSWWATAGSLLIVLAIAIRAVLEERLLKTTLAGYAGYAARVRYRLVPLVW
ncbi:MAG: isoprenylcysteine carboxylmethyltransferase family protein [Alphaproteobacteria bacterium]|nr:isoprenylcysteine carboxylmethyltransferase family protein [Alphaproteobacteria bacterium]